MQQNSDFEREYRLKANFVYVVALYIFFRRLISHAMLTQMQGPPVIFGEKEVFYKVFLASHFVQFITSHTLLAPVFDISLLICAMGFMLSYKRIYAILFSVLVIIYFLSYNIVTGHHYHGMIALIVISIPFWFNSERRFNFSWEAVRYYFLFIFASAALWKIFRGTAFSHDQLSIILKSQQLDMMIQNPASYRTHIAEYLISRADVSFAILLVNVLFQLTFLVGFFTKKFDQLIFWMAIIFCIANYFIMGIVSVELLILNLTLLDWKRIENYLIKRELLTA